MTETHPAPPLAEERLSAFDIAHRIVYLSGRLRFLKDAHNEVRRVHLEPRYRALRRSGQTKSSTDLAAYGRPGRTLHLSMIPPGTMRRLRAAALLEAAPRKYYEVVSETEPPYPFTFYMDGGSTTKKSPYWNDIRSQGWREERRLRGKHPVTGEAISHQVADWDFRTAMAAGDAMAATRAALNAEEKELRGRLGAVLLTDGSVCPGEKFSFPVPMIGSAAGSTVVRGIPKRPSLRTNFDLLEQWERGGEFITYTDRAATFRVMFHDSGVDPEIDLKPFEGD